MPELTAREKIVKYCKVQKEAGDHGEVLVFGRRRYRMSTALKDHTDAECERIVRSMELDSHIMAKEAVSDKRRARLDCSLGVPAERKPCECGCGRSAKAGSHFLPGHDAKLKSALRKISGEPAGKGGAPRMKAAVAELKRRGWA